MMALFKNVLVFAPVSEINCLLPEPHPSKKSPHCKVSSSSCSISQTLSEITKWEGKPRRNKLSKDYIGTPGNFKHLCHIGWNPQTGFVANLEPELKMVFAQAGITQAHLKNKRTSKKIFETIEKRGGMEAVLEEAKTKGLLTKSLDHPLLYSVMPSELGSTCSPQSELNCHSPSMKDGCNNVTVSSSTSESYDSSHNGDLPSVVISPPLCMSPSKKTSHHNLIQNLKEVQLKRAKSDQQLIPFSQVAVTCQIRNGTQLKPVLQNPTSPSDGGIVAALKDAIQKRHKAIHVSDSEESDLENGDE